MVEVHGSLFFGNAGPLQRKLGPMRDADAIILHMGDVRYLDQSGVYALSDLINDLAEAGTVTYIAELHEEPRDLLARLGVAPGIVAASRIFSTAEEAVRVAMAWEASRRDPSKVAESEPGPESVVV